MAHVCENCKFRAHYDQKPNSALGRFWRWHINFCPGWRSYFSREGLQHTSQLTVDDTVTAIAMGSGNMPVLATPAMMALMENAAMLAVADHLPQGSTTVGGHIASSHLKPSRLGDTVTATATVTRIDGKKIEFKVEARCGDTLLGEGTHLRFVVDQEKFMSRL